MEQNTARYSLAFSWLPPAFNQTLVQQNLPPAWIGTILDRDDKVIARSRDPDRFLGQPATPDLRARLADSNDGILRSVSLDGIPTVVAYSRSPTYGWAAVVAVPQSEVFANVRRSMGWILVLAIGLITAGLLASAVTARLITRPLKMLQEAAEATGQGALRDPPKTGLVEVDEVGAALRRSAVQIQERERRQELLRHELDHRAKNLLTVVMSILQLTRAQDTKTFIENVLGRIMALARTHNLLADTGWERVELRRLLIDNLEPFLSRDRKFTIHGPSIELEASAGQVIGIIIHELVTNSAKYGALSASRGELNVAWRLMQEGLDFHWAERGGPHVSRPLGRGFGLTVIEASVAKQLEGRVSLEWLAEGLRATLWIPRNHVAGQNAPAAPNFGENAVVKKPADVAGRASEEIIQA